MWVHTFTAALLISICISVPDAVAQYRGTTQEAAPWQVPISTAGQGFIEGTIQGETAAIQSVRIQVQDLSAGRNFETTSDQDGRFRLALPTGTYLVTATSGTETVTQQVQVTESLTTVDLRLRAKANSAGSENQGSISVAQMKVPEKARGTLRKARDAAKKSNLGDAYRYVQKALELYPSYAEALTFRGLLERDNRPEQALADTQKAVEYDPNYGMGYVALGSAYTQLGRFDEAVRSLERALVIVPTA